MANRKSLFVCQSCGNEFSKWAGRCPGCGEWNTLVETNLGVTSGRKKSSTSTLKPQKLADLKTPNLTRVPTGFGELDRVLGGGLVPGSVILLAGEPGIGKSTLILQLTAKLAAQKSTPVLYVSGEESLGQLKSRADRLDLKTEGAVFASGTEVEPICREIDKSKPALAVIDSIQTMTSGDLSGPAGSVGQVREATLQLIRVAKANRTAILLIGHVTKQGVVAGPKVLEHMVDSVITFEGEKFADFRLLRAAKNRFGATFEVGIFEMTDKGLKEVTNPSRLMIENRVPRTPGSVITVAMEGTRPILTEIQALAVPSQLPVPRRVARGVDFNRLQLITAVLTKHLHLNLGTYDITVNAAGGMRVIDPGADLAIALAIWSSVKNKSIGAKTAVFGEVGLLGEIRPVHQSLQREKEAQRLGFTSLISPAKIKTLKQALTS